MLYKFTCTLNINLVGYIIHVLLFNLTVGGVKLGVAPQPGGATATTGGLTLGAKPAPATGFVAPTAAPVTGLKLGK